MTSEEFKRESQKLINTCNKYGFMDRTIRPYSFNMTVRQLVNGWRDYDRCTFSSKQIMQSEYRGLADIVASWVKVENEPMVSVFIVKGNHKGEIKQYKESVANDLVELELAEFWDFEITEPID